MLTYVTGELNLQDCMVFTAFINDEIGVEYEVDSYEEDVYTVTVYELTNAETNKLRFFELKNFQG